MSWVSEGAVSYGGLKMLRRAVLRAWHWAHLAGDAVFRLELGWHEDRLATQLPNSDWAGHCVSAF